MNGAETRRGGSGGGGVGYSAYNPERMPPPAVQPLVTPPGKVLVEGYKKEIYSPMNTTRPQSFTRVDLKDSIQIHLLTETALSDSKSFEILPQEEVDELKKQVQSMTMRVEQARANLAIQSKYRDAAVSMARLYSSPRGDNKRMSDSAKEAEMEKEASERRCEQLAAELFELEKRLMEPQKRLLQHTAAILQLTHRASSKKSGLPQLVQPMMNGIPGSPESLYTYTNTRNSMEIPTEELDINDRSLYLPLDGPGTRGRKNTIEIPMKSPIREQNAQLRELREELERIKEENSRYRSELEQLKEDNQRLQEAEQELKNEAGNSTRLKEAGARLQAIEQQMGVQMDALQAQSSGQQRTISDTESKLEDLNNRLREMIIAFNPEKNAEFKAPGAAAGSGETLTNQLDYLEQGISTAMEEQQLSLSVSKGADRAVAEASAASAETAVMATALAKAEGSLDQIQERMQTINRQVQFLLQQANASQPAPVDGNLEEQFEFLENALDVISSELTRALEEQLSVSAGKRDIEQVDAVLMGLWEIIQTGYAEIAQQKAARRQARALGQQNADDDEELSSNEFEPDLSEPYSLQAFSTKVQWLYTQATSLREQKYILQRQIKQQRELNNRSESEKDQELQAKKEELEKTHILLDDSERAAKEAQDQLQRLLVDMETLQKTSVANETASSSASKATEEKLKERNAQFAAMESEYREVQTRLATVEANMANVQTQYDEANQARLASEAELTSLHTQVNQEKEARLASEAEVASLQTKLSQATEAKSAADAEAERLEEQLKTKDEELDQLNMMVIELKTEMTIAKAELDGAYGSRQQRAAEVAKFTNKEETAQLNSQVVKLRSELENALRDLEDITRESINAEKEKLDLESKLDDALASRQNLEAEVKMLSQRLDKAKEELDKEKLRPPPSPAAMGGSSRAGASMLSEQFRATMKEERRKYQEEIRVSFNILIICAEIYVY
ncbi:Up-regulated during septation-domain-containing protein [Podospora fimiseda]|uniref:Up-regulated during septation-domain-containing protein n=1 Tax=Podospora fimiseda TaxID=252190 RepID=A0AAN7BKJ5_9PEZI|nr:Up-regulated during septation-domain-containing protein [Podospora fimiseda]